MKCDIKLFKKGKTKMLKIRITIHSDNIVTGLSVASSYALDAGINEMKVISVSSETSEDRPLPYTFTLFINDELPLEEWQQANMERVKELAKAGQEFPPNLGPAKSPDIDDIPF